MNRNVFTWLNISENGTSFKLALYKTNQIISLDFWIFYLTQIETNLIFRLWFFDFFLQVFPLTLTFWEGPFWYWRCGKTWGRFSVSSSNSSNPWILRPRFWSDEIQNNYFYWVTSQLETMLSNVCWTWNCLDYF